MVELNPLRALLLCAVIVGLSACNSEPVQETSARQQGPPQPRMQEYSFVWHETAGSDLYSPDGTFIRAVIESVYRSFDGDGPSDGFPGFAAAVSGSPSAMRLLDLVRLRRTATDEEIGVLHARILRIDDTSIPVVADVCVYRDDVHVALEHDPKRYSARIPADLALDPNRVWYVRNGASPPSNLTGTAHRPAASPFGQWQVTDFIQSAPERPYTERLEREAECESARGDIPKSDNAPGTIPKSEVPRVMPFPGWPEASP